MYSLEGNHVTQHTGIEFPIFQAPISLISRADPVAAASGAGVDGIVLGGGEKGGGNSRHGLHTFALLQKARPSTNAWGWRQLCLM